MSECDSKVSVIMFGWLFAISKNRYKPETKHNSKYILYNEKERQHGSYFIYED